MLFSNSVSPESKKVEVALRTTGVPFEAVQVDRLSFGMAGEGPSWAQLVSEDLTARSGIEQLPLLYVGGQLVGGLEEVEDLSMKGELRRLAEEAGVELLEPQQESQSLGEWSLREDGRWIPPKNLSGRRYWSDEPNMEMYEGEHNDPMRKLWVEAVGGRHKLTLPSFSESSANLIADLTGVFKPDKHNRTYAYPPLTKGNLSGSSYDLFLGDDRSTLARKRFRRVTKEEAERKGVTVRDLYEIYAMGRKAIIQELTYRQRYNAIASSVDVENLRDELIDEMAKCRVWSPSGNSLVPGLVHVIERDELVAEREADTDVPLLIYFEGRNPQSIRGYDEVRKAARKILRAARVVRVQVEDAPDKMWSDRMSRRPQVPFPEAARGYNLFRVPALVWLAGARKGGQELGRKYGAVAAEEIVKWTREAIDQKVLSPSSGRPIDTPYLLRHKALFSRYEPAGGTG